MNIPPNVDFSDYIKIVGDLEAQEIHSAGHWRDQVLARANGPTVWGDKLPWSKTHDDFRLRPGEITVWAGMNGHRKSMVVGQVMLWLSREKKIAIASLEMLPEETLFRMCMQASGITSGVPSKDLINRFMDFSDKNILVYDQLDNVATEKVLGFVHYCAQELGAEHIVIDSLAKCGLGVEDRQAETNFVNRLGWAAKHLKVHIHLVHHVRKPHTAGEDYQPNKFDVKGSSTLTDLVDNVVIVWKDKKRELAKQLGNDPEYLATSFDQKLIIEKQRHGSYEGTFGLYSHPSMQFVPQEGRALPFPLQQGASHV